MRYFLPPADEPTPRTIRGVAPVGATPRAGPHPEPDLPAPAEGRLVRTVRMPVAEAAAYLARWQSEPGPASAPLAAPPGVTAHERWRPDRVVPGLRRIQRLAIAATGAEATALHWSAPGSLHPGDHTAWESALARLGPRPAARGWTA